MYIYAYVKDQLLQNYQNLNQKKVARYSIPLLQKNASSMEGTNIQNTHVLEAVCILSMFSSIPPSSAAVVVGKACKFSFLEEKSLVWSGGYIAAQFLFEQQ